MEKIKKKGAIEMEYVIIAAILIIAFIALAYFLIRLNIQGLGEDVACKLSILAKATAPGLWLVDPKASIPVECVTKKICIGGECDDVDGSFKGEKNVESIELKNNADKDLPVIEKTVADAFYNCWKDMGEGKLDLFGSHEDAKPRCVVCSRIALDKSIPQSTTDIIDINKHLKTKSPDNSKLNYLQSMGLQSEENIDFDAMTASASKFGTGNPRKTSEVAVVFMQVSAESSGASAVEYGLGGLGVASAGKGAQILGRKALYKVTQIPLVGTSIYRKVIFPVRSSTKNLVKVAGRVAGVVTVAVTAGLMANGEINAWADRIVVASHCGTYQSSGEKGSEGCSQVQIVPYDRDSINFMCDVVEAEA